MTGGTQDNQRIPSQEETRRQLLERDAAQPDLKIPGPPKEENMSTKEEREMQRAATKRVMESLELEPSPTGAVMKAKATPQFRADVDLLRAAFGMTPLAGGQARTRSAPRRSRRNA